MHADFSILQLVLQLLTLRIKILLLFFLVLLYSYPLKVPHDYCLILRAGGREGNRGLNKMCAGERTRERRGERKADEKEINQAVYRVK